MRADDCREWRERIGALALGQLPDDERFAVEAHLEGCPACRAEAEALAPVASLLRRADPGRLTPAPEPPPDLGERIARRIAAERRSEGRRRTRLRFGLATAGAAAAAAAAALLLVIGGGSSQSSHSETVAFRSLPRDAWAEASLVPHPWGSEISLQVGGFHPGTQCQVWLRRDDGKRVPAGSFRYVYRGGSEHAGLSSAVTLDNATAIGLRVGRETFVAPLPSHSAGAGASLTPTTRPRGDI
jgi:putative zinc finger protein